MLTLILLKCFSVIFKANQFRIKNGGHLEVIKAKKIVKANKFGMSA